MEKFVIKRLYRDRENFDECYLKGILYDYKNHDGWSWNDYSSDPLEADAIDKETADEIMLYVEKHSSFVTENCSISFSCENLHELRGKITGKKFGF